MILKRRHFPTIYARTYARTTLQAIHCDLASINFMVVVVVVVVVAAAAAVPANRLTTTLSKKKI